MPGEAVVLARTVIAVELGWGIPIDIYKMVRGYQKPLLFGWIAIHIVISTTGVLALG